jgi:hypothetical protein
MKYSFLLLAAIMLPGQQAPPQPPPAADPHAPSRVEGKVINAANGEAVRKAAVLLQSRNGGQSLSYAAESDGNGKFHIDNVDPGKYAVSADRQGFMLQVAGATGAPPPTVTVEDGHSLADVVIRLNPLGVIAGRVVDEEGDPVRGAQVQAMVYGYVAGKRQLRNGQQTQSNDKGEFRLYGLRPGTFYLYATNSNNSRLNPPGQTIRGPRPAGNAATYFPNTTDVARAVPIEVEAGAQLRGFDIHMRREKLYSVRGKLPEQQGDQFRRGFSVQVVTRGVTDFRPASFGSTMNNTTFECPGLPPGEYMVIGTMYDGDKRTLARQAVDIVNADVEVTLNFSPPSDLSGMVRVDGKISTPLQDLRVGLQPEAQSMFGGASAEVQADGSFVLHNVSPDVYLINFGSPEGTYIKSAGLVGQEGANQRVDLTKGSGPLVITLGTDIGVVEGSVQNAAGDPAVRVRVNLIPYGTTLIRPELGRTAFTDEKGNFKMRGTAPGEYKLFAWENVEVGAPQDPEFRKPYEKQAVSVTLAPNGHESVKLTSIKVTAK